MIFYDFYVYTVQYNLKWLRYNGNNYFMYQEKEIWPGDVEVDQTTSWWIICLNITSYNQNRFLVIFRKFMFTPLLGDPQKKPKR